jgi:predicted nuclease of restriction endonuclease-like RecB superfamily
VWIRGSKFRNKRTETAGRSFASKAEAVVFQHLKALEDMAAILDLKCQVQVYLTESKILMKPDFSFLRAGVRVYAECKGFETAVYRIKRRLWRHYGPGSLEVYVVQRGAVVLKEIVKSKART